MDSISSSLINEIITASKLLIAKTNPTDHLVFIGQSPDYLTCLVGTQRKISRIPMSGRVYCDEWNIPPIDKVKKYFEFIDTFNLDSSNIVLVDHSHSGKSISGFSKLLNRYFGFINLENTQWNYNVGSRVFPFINIISPGQKNGWIHRPDPAFVHTIGFIQMPSLVDLANTKYLRTMPHFQFCHWDNPNYELSSYNVNYQELCLNIQTQYNCDKFLENHDVCFKANIIFGSDEKY